MPIRVTRSAGMLLLAVWLIPTGVAGLMPLALPAVVSAVLALLGGCADSDRAIGGERKPPTHVNDDSCSGCAGPEIAARKSI
jgi:hypothetical protein